MKLVKVFIFPDKMSGFSKVIGLCLKFCLGFSITYLVLRMIHIWHVQVSGTPPPLIHLRPKFFHSLDLGRLISKESPLFQIITNQLKKSIIQQWLLYVIRSFFQVGFRFQYQLINLFWFSFDFFSFSWSLAI